MGIPPHSPVSAALFSMLEGLRDKNTNMFDSLAARLYTPCMTNDLPLDKASLIKAKKAHQRRLALIERALEVIRDWEAVEAVASRNGETLEQVTESDLRPLRELVAECVQKTKKFTRTSLIQVVRSEYPKAKFSDKSLDRPLADLLKSGKVVVVQKNIGNKQPAIYEFKE